MHTQWLDIPEKSLFVHIRKNSTNMLCAHLTCRPFEPILCIIFTNPIYQASLEEVVTFSKACLCYTVAYEARVVLMAIFSDCSHHLHSSPIKRKKTKSSDTERRAWACYYLALHQLSDAPDMVCDWATISEVFSCPFDIFLLVLQWINHDELVYFT